MGTGNECQLGLAEGNSLCVEKPEILTPTPPCTSKRKT